MPAAPAGADVAAPEPLAGSVPEAIDAISGVPVDVRSIPLHVEPERVASMAAPMRPAEREPLPPSAEKPISVAAPAAPAEPARPAPRLPDLPPVSMSLPEDSGLELVQTKPRDEVPIEEPAAPPRPRRVRPPRAAAAEEPLQMVETRHGDEGPAPGA